MQQGQTTQQNAVSQASIRQNCGGCQSCLLVMTVGSATSPRGGHNARPERAAATAWVTGADDLAINSAACVRARALLLLSPRV
jgi:hypothetical protein